uniref:Uncharacterized protein n=1 Tax=viral metagenome TaxID=1070528 RepID=A0A6M3JL50_9ZZZZ
MYAVEWHCYMSGHGAVTVSQSARRAAIGCPIVTEKHIVQI